MGSRITVNCRICDKKISYKKVGSLGEHLLLRHPQESINYYTYVSGTRTETKSRGLGRLAGLGGLVSRRSRSASPAGGSSRFFRRKRSRSKSAAGGSSGLFDRIRSKSRCSNRGILSGASGFSFKKRSRSTSRSTVREGSSTEGHNKMYKTSVETWRPGTSPLKCLFCGKSGQPLIRKQRNKITQSSLGALCLLGCWPLCFLPFILGGSNVMNLYCKYCGEFLGTYDRKTGRLQPPDKDAANAKAPNICECGNN